MTVEEFAQMMQDQVQADLKRRFPDSPHMWNEITQVKHGGAYAKVDVGPPHNMSGRYMIEYATGVIYGIKGYGKVHKGHRYGTLDTAGDRYWGGYRPQPVSDAEATS